MRPISFLGQEELDVWGNEELETLLNHYGMDKEHTWKDGRELRKATSKAVIDAEKARREWIDLKNTVVAKKYPRKSMVSLWGLINCYHKEEFPNLLKLASLAISCPVNTAGCERGFSIQNQTLTPLRNRLNTESQDQLMRIKINGEKYDQFEFNTALELWKSKSKRKIYS